MQHVPIAATILRSAMDCICWTSPARAHPLCPRVQAARWMDRKFAVSTGRWHQILSINPEGDDFPAGTVPLALEKERTMEWFSAFKPPTLSITDFFKHRYRCDDECCRMRILAASIIHPLVVYAAVEWVMKNADPTRERRQVVGVVFALRHRHARCGQIDWQEISEDLLPPYTDCPVHILRLLTRKDGANANRWRALCWAKAQRRTGDYVPCQGRRRSAPARTAA
jgi:hypothetical protein